MNITQQLSLPENITEWFIHRSKAYLSQIKSLHKIKETIAACKKATCRSVINRGMTRSKIFPRGNTIKEI